MTYPKSFYKKRSKYIYLKNKYNSQKTKSCQTDFGDLIFVSSKIFS